jgi:hypothetical protein
MENTSQQADETLDQFDKWLKENKIEPQSSLLPAIRARLHEEVADFDTVLDELFQPDTRLRNPDMVEKVRLRIRSEEPETAANVVWFKWLAPLAAAATLALTFISFQNRAPDGALLEAPSPVLTVTEPAVSATDPELIDIFALAANLEGGPEMTKLESVEDLAFLFD